jgi:hypothetical protein
MDRQLTTADRACLAENLVSMADVSRRYRVARATASIWKRNIEAAGHRWPEPVYTGQGDGNVNQSALYWWPDVVDCLDRFRQTKKLGRPRTDPASVVGRWAAARKSAG